MLEPAIIILSLGLMAVIVIPAMIVGISLAIRFARRQDKVTAGDEARLVQDIHRKLNRLEQRIESLETILTEGERKTPGI